MSSTSPSTPSVPIAPIPFSPPADNQEGANPPPPPPFPLHLYPPPLPGLFFPWPQFQTSAQPAPPPKPKRRQVKTACTNCAQACKRCDESRPCLRCRKYCLEESCQDGQRKERKKGTKRGPYKRKVKTGEGSTDTLVEASAPPLPPFDFTQNQHALQQMITALSQSGSATATAPIPLPLPEGLPFFPVPVSLPLPPSTDPSASGSSSSSSSAPPLYPFSIPPAMYPYLFQPPPPVDLTPLDKKVKPEDKAEPPSSTSPETAIASSSPPQD